MKIELGSGMKFSDERLTNIYEWFLRDILTKVWFNDRFQSCAKGGEWGGNPKFESKKDMPYLSHIISGASMILRVIDLGIEEKKLSDLNDIEFKIKRGLIGFLFHDYNKIINSSYKMDEKDRLISLIKELNFNGLLNEVGLNYDTLYDLVISTEIGTQFNALGKFQDQSIRFEKDMVRAADKLSSVFNESDSKLDMDIIVGDFILKKDNIKSIKFTPSIYYALTDLVKLSLIEELNSLGLKYLWVTEFAIYYYSCSKASIDLLGISNKLIEGSIGAYLDIVSPHSGIKFTDRKIKNPARGIIKIDVDAVNRFLLENNLFNSVITPIKGSIEGKYFELLDKYRERISKNLKSVFIDLVRDNDRFDAKKILKLRDISYEDNDAITERKKIFIIRTIQLELNDPKKLKKGEYKNILLLWDKLNKFVNENKAIFIPFESIYKGRSKLLKSPFLNLLFISEEKIEDSIYENALIEILNSWNKDVIDLRGKLESIIKYILGISILEMEEVPDKSEMAIVTGYKASRRGLSENTYGIRTNSSFSNKVIISKIANFNIDDNYAIEALLRRYWVMNEKSEYSTNFLYLVFPGAVAYMDIAGLVDKLKNTENKSILTIRALEIGLDSPTRGKRLDNSYFFDPGKLNNNEDAFKVLELSLNLIMLTKLKCLIIDTHSPPIENQLEIFRMETKEFFTKDLKWDKIRCNKISEVLDFVRLFKIVFGYPTIGKPSKKINIPKVLNDFIEDPISIFHHLKLKYMVDPKLERRLFENKDYDVHNGINKLINQYISQAPNGGNKKMKEIRELADIAFELMGPKFPRSTNERTWMLRDTLDALEKMSAIFSGKNDDLNNFKDIISSRIFKGLEKDNKYNVKNELIEKFSETLINLINDSFGRKVPAGTLKSYIIDAFEFNLMKKYYDLSNQVRGVK
jgi:hypothetical protein